MFGFEFFAYLRHSSSVRYVACHSLCLCSINSFFWKIEGLFYVMKCHMSVGHISWETKILFRKDLSCLKWLLSLFLFSLHCLKYFAISLDIWGWQPCSMMTDETHPKHRIIRHIIIDRLLVAPLLGTFLSDDFSKLPTLLNVMHREVCWSLPYLGSPPILPSTGSIILL